MALHQDQHKSKTYLNIVNGKLAQKTGGPCEGAVPRKTTNKEGKEIVVHEFLFSYIDGIISSLELIEGGKFGDQLLINISDNGEGYTISMSLSSREAKSFLSKLPNIKIKEPVELVPFDFISKEKKRVIGLNVIQNKVKVASFYTKDNLNGMPSNGDKQLDPDEFKILMMSQTIFLKKQLKAFIAKHFTAPVQEMQVEIVQGHPDMDECPFPDDIMYS